MPSRYLLETSSVDGYLLEDGSGVLLLNSPPTITSQPSNTSVAEGATANFSVVADDAVSYQWQELLGTETFIRFSTLSGMSESGNSSTGWIYTGTATDGTAGTPDWNLPISTAGNFSVETALGGSTPLAGLYTTTSGAWDSNFLMIAYPSSGNWVANGPGFSNLVTITRTYTSGDRVRIGYSDTGNTYLIEIARAADPSTWLVLGTGTLARSGTLYPRLISFGASGAILTVPKTGVTPTWTNVSTGSGGTTATYTTPTTTLAMSGRQYRVLVTNTDGTTISVTVTLTVTAGGGTTFTITPTGSVTFSGTVVPGKGKALQPSGSVTFSGTVALIKDNVIIPTGTVTFSGTAALSFQKNVVITPTGSVVLSGNAPITFSNGSTTWTITPTGSVSFTGTTAQNHNRVFLASGTISFSGTVQALLSRVMTPSGQLTFSGTTVFLHSKLLLPDGTLVLSGTAPISFNGGSVVATVSTRLPLTSAGTT